MFGKRLKSLPGVIGLLAATSCFPSHAFDIGYERNNSTQTFSFKLEAIIERYYRTLQAPTEAIADAWFTEGLSDAEIKERKDNFTVTEYLTGELNVYNLIIRPTVSYKNVATAYIDLAIFDDVRTSAAPPYMLGGGGYISREIYPGITASLFGSVHITERYRYKLELYNEDNAIYENAEFVGRMIIGSGGLIVSTEVDLDDVDIIPYVGLENTLHRTNSTITKLCPGRGCQVDLINPDKTSGISMRENEFIYAVAGITLRRPNETTMRLEWHGSQTDWNLSGGLGIKF